ncbi:methyltransferase [Kitasatospora sp. NPDC059803]|uniref:methyltransferase n=1 Tax=Kitasatospora sp. NPDC059803 TaxID=3346953 RepID=UPI003648EC01
MTPDTAAARRTLADRLEAGGALSSPALRAAVEAVPREPFLRPGVFVSTGRRRWRPVTELGADPTEWVELAYSNRSLVTQLNGHLTADQASAPVRGFPTASTTAPAATVRMIDALGAEDGHTVLEIGTGTGYSTALLRHLLGERNVGTVEADPKVTYDRVIATHAVRRIPYAWVQRTKPGGTILATVGTWPEGAGLARVTVAADGTADGRFIDRSTLPPVRPEPLAARAGGLAARAEAAAPRRLAHVSPTLLNEPTPAILAQLAFPSAKFTVSIGEDLESIHYLATPGSAAEVADDTYGWTVHQSGPVPLWDEVERILTAWQEAGRPDLTAVRLRITDRATHYWIDGHPALRWEHAAI